MANNPYDQFDAVVANPYDQFDATEQAQAAPATPAQPQKRSFMNDVGSYASGLAQGISDIPDSINDAVIGTGMRASDAVGLTEGMYDKFKKMKADPMLNRPTSPAFNTGRVTGDIASTLPASGMRVVGAGGKAASTIEKVARAIPNNFARGVAGSVPFVNQSELPPEDTLGLGGVLGVGLPAAWKALPAVGTAAGAYYGATRGGDPLYSVPEYAALGATLGFAPKIGLKVAGRAATGAMDWATKRLGGTASGGAPVDEMRAAQYATSRMPQTMTLDDLAASKAPFAAQAMGGQAPTAVKALGNRAGTTGTMVSDRVSPYNQPEARIGRVLDSAKRYFGVDPAAAKGEMDEFVNAGRKAAAPLYRVANEGGSIAPLQAQYEKEFGNAITAEHAATQALQDSENEVLTILAKQSRGEPIGDTLYEARAKSMEAQKALEAAQQDKGDVLEALHTSQDDAANNVKGGIWSPWLKRALSDPIAKSGLRKGLEVQRIEALKDNVRFDPTELAITGTDEAGDPIVSKVPNMRTYDAVKRGLDEIINEAKDKFGRIQWTERLHAIDGVRRRLVDELRQRNPDYGAALDKAGDYLSAQGAFNKIQNTLANDKVSVRDFKAMYDKLTDAEKAAGKGGAVNMFFNKGQTLSLREGKFLTPLARQKFGVMLGKEGADKFASELEQEVANQNFFRYAAPRTGSPTMPLSEEAAAQDTFGDANVVDTIMHRMGTGKGPVTAVRTTAGERMAKAYGALKTLGLSEDARNKAGDIFTMSPQEAAEYLKRVLPKAPAGPQEAIPFGFPGRAGAPSANYMLNGRTNTGR